jgi:hypothetical protein
VKNDVFGNNAPGQVAVDVDAHLLRLALQQALACEHHFHLAGTDSEGNGAEGSVR